MAEPSISAAAAANSVHFRAYAQAAYHAMPADDRAMAEAFELAQLAQQSEAAEALQQMSARIASKNPEIEKLARERNDIYKRVPNLFQVLPSNKVGPSPVREIFVLSGDEKSLAHSDIRTKLSEINERIKKIFPKYSSLLGARPLTLNEVQNRLRNDEVLILFMDLPQSGVIAEETIIWAISKTSSRWVRSALGTAALNEVVATLRCGVDESAWIDTNCTRLTGQSYTDADALAGKLLPFDLGLAHKLYLALLEPVADLIANRHLVIVPSGPLTHLPLHLLVTDAPNSSVAGTEAYRRAAWIPRRHAITVLPAVSSLMFLREVARESRASKPYIGIGNPLLDGPDSRYQRLALAARDHNHCPKDLWTLKSKGFIAPNRRVLLSSQNRLADNDQVRLQIPLPETADELCAVGHDLGSKLEDIRLGERATEKDVKALNESGVLSQYRILHFATHAALADQLTGGTEPGLILTPPVQSSENDDGYLDASEIATLHLDADWVLLSACNTAAEVRRGEEPLSGLARAFFYAGARSLLVSHWAVNSEATVKLISNAVKQMSLDPRVGRSEAVRQSMLQLIDHGNEQEAHPAFWAPFVVVGNGNTAFKLPFSEKQKAWKRKDGRSSATIAGGWRTSIVNH